MIKLRLFVIHLDQSSLISYIVTLAFICLFSYALAGTPQAQTGPASITSADQAVALGEKNIKQDTERAIKYFYRAHQLEPENLEAMYWLARLLARKRDYKASLNYMEKLMRLAESNGRKDVLAANLGNLGIAYKNAGDYDKAEKTYLKGIRINQELDNKLGLIRNYANLGILHLIKRDHDQAEKFIHKSLKIQLNSKYKSGMATNYTNLGNIQRERGNHASAEEYFLKGLKGSKRNQSNFLTATIYSQLGKNCTDQGKIDEARDWHLKSLRLSVRINNKSEIAHQFRYLGILYARSGMFYQAQESYEKAIVAFNKLGDARWADEVKRRLKKLQSAQ